MAGAIFHSAALAQVRDTARTKRDTARGPTDTITARRDTTAKRDTTKDVRVALPKGADSLLQRDSLLRRDSARAVVRDTIKPPLTTAEAPVLADPTGSFVWDRRDLFSTGALTVEDLLERVPGVTTVRSHWISEPMIGAFLGDPGRVRVFLDGLELEELDPRMHGVWDLTQIPLWALDDIRIERGASEIRIYMRSWRVDRTTPYSRTDIYTGDLNTNLYRGLFGRRYQHGEALQVAAQQFGTNPGRTVESSDQLGVLARVGIARKRWSADALLLRGDRNRGRTFTDPLRDTIPATQSTRSDAYARFGWGNPDHGAWVQGIASASKLAYGGQKATTTSGATADTTRYRAQYVLTGGYGLGPIHASVTQRLRTGLFRRVATPSARVGLETRLVTLSVLGEGRDLDSTRRVDASAVVRPLSFVFFSGAVGTEQPQIAPDSLPGAKFLRAEAGLRLRDVWVSGGAIRRDAVLLDAPTIFRRRTLASAVPSAQGAFATIRGRVWKAIYADAQGIAWNDTGSFYRPKYQARSELYISTSLIDRFPSGNFHLLASAVHEYRSGSVWPDSAGTIRLGGYRTISTLLQVRILMAEVFWNFRNVLGERYEQIPGYRLPRMTSIYGVRWEFWN